MSAPVKLLSHLARNRRLRAPVKPSVDRRRLVTDPQLRQEVDTAVGRYLRTNPSDDSSVDGVEVGDPTPGTKRTRARLEWRHPNGS